MSQRSGSQRAVERERWEVLRHIEDWLELPMVILGFIWILLLVTELVWGISPLLSAVTTGIWIAFIGDFLLRFVIAPRKISYLKNNWITAIALALPGFRVLRAVRAFRALRVARGIRLARVITSTNRGMRALSRVMGRRGLGYVVSLTVLVNLSGAAGMLAFERSPGEMGLNSYGESLWWTTMLLTTIGSEYWPNTPEGKVLTLFLAIYSLAVLGYITAALASFFVERDASDPEAALSGDRSLRALQSEVLLLRKTINELHASLRTDAGATAAKDGLRQALSTTTSPDQ